MKKGIRKKLHHNSNIKIYIVKNDKFRNRKTMSIAYNTKNNDAYILVSSKQCKCWHNDWWWKVALLHELGHLNNRGKYHFQKEIWATLYGFFKYKKSFFPELKISQLLLFFKTTWGYHLFGEDQTRLFEEDQI